MLLPNEPMPEPSLVFESATVGFSEVLQHTPRAVTEDPPSEVILPPEDAVVEVRPEMAVVVIAGKVAPAVKVISVP